MGKKAKQKRKEKKKNKLQRQASQSQSPEHTVKVNGYHENDNNKENRIQAQVNQRKKSEKLVKEEDRKVNDITVEDTVEDTKATPEEDEDNNDIPQPKHRLSLPSVVVLDWKKQSSIGPGLQNLGNTCFMNSVLQCLTYCAPLVNYLVYQENSHSTAKCNGFCFACLLSTHMKASHSSSKTSVIRPLEFAKKLGAISKNFRLGRQEDAHEYLRHVIDHMCKTSVAAFESRRDVKLDSLSKETTAFNRLFGGYLRSQVICRECESASNAFDYIMDFMLDIRNVTTLTQAFQKFIKPENLEKENAYKCEKCKKKCPAVKRFTIHRPPNVATIQLKRFEFNRSHGGKISKHIEFPLTLDLRPFLSDTTGPPVLYSLSSVLVHFGMSCNSGHYFCFVKSPSGSWFRMDDSSVTSVSVTNVLNQDAYILFYTRTMSRSPAPNNGLSNPQSNPQSSKNRKRLNSRSESSDTQVLCNGTSKCEEGNSTALVLYEDNTRSDSSQVPGDQSSHNSDAYKVNGEHEDLMEDLGRLTLFGDDKEITYDFSQPMFPVSEEMMTILHDLINNHNNEMMDKTSNEKVIVSGEKEDTSTTKCDVTKDVETSEEFEQD